MLRVEQALEFIELEGSDLDRYRSRFLFNEERDDTIAAWLFGSYQARDGGFPRNLEIGEESSLTETATLLGYMNELGIQDSRACRMALDFVRSRQHPEGYWQEHHAQLEFGDQMGGEGGRAWLSAYMGRKICKILPKDASEIKLVRNFLLAIQNDAREFGLSPTIHFLALGFFGLLDGPQCGRVAHGLEFALNNFTTSNNPKLIVLEASSLLDAGVTHKETNLIGAKKRLIKLQGPDGEWESPGSQSVSITIDVLKLLLNLKAWRIVEEV